jgi:RNA polymerase sigma-70 factor (ECF subfamily)
MTLEFSDGHLVEEVMGGSTVAFERLMTRYERLVFKIAFSCSGQYDSALDILQNVFLKVHRKLAGFRTDGDFKNWIAKIAVNESINWKRSQKRFQADALDESMQVASAPVQERQVGDRETWEMVKRSMDTLNPANRAALGLRYLEGMSIRDVAVTLDCSEGTVKSLIFRGLKQMRLNMGTAGKVEP